TNGSMPNDGGSLLMTIDEYHQLLREAPAAADFCRKFLGSHDSIHGELRYCLWIPDDEVQQANQIPAIMAHVERVRHHREASDREETRSLAELPHAFGERRHRPGRAVLIPRHSSESRPYLPSLLVSDDTIIGDSAIAMYDFAMSDLAVYSSRMHVV